MYSSITPNSTPSSFTGRNGACSVGFLGRINIIFYRKHSAQKLTQGRPMTKVLLIISRLLDDEFMSVGIGKAGREALNHP